MNTTTQRIPLEQLLEEACGKRALTLGVPAPDGHSRRFALTPEGAAMLVNRGFDVRIEREAGRAIHYPDARYLRAGARMVSRAEAFGCDMVLAAGTLDVADALRVRRGALVLTLMSAITGSADAMRVLLERHVVTLALDLVADQNGHTPFADILTEIDGRAAMAAASTMLADPASGKGILLGGIAGIVPCEVTVIGAGIGGMAAARSAIGLGATVRMFDTDVYRLREAAAQLGDGVITSAMHPKVVVTALRTADVVIASQTHMPHAVDADVVAEMKRGVLTFSIDGTATGAMDTSPVFPSMPCVDLSDGERARAVLRANVDAAGDRPVRRVCFTNAAATVPRTVAMALSNALTTMFADIALCGGAVSNALKLHPGMQRAVCTFMGKPVNARLARRLGMRPVDINLLLQFS